MLTVSYIDIENSIMLMSYFVWYLTKVEKAKQRIVIPGTNLFWVYYLDTFHEFSQFICRCGLNMETFQVSKILWGGQKNISQKSWCLVKMLWRQMLFFFFFGESVILFTYIKYKICSTCQILFARPDASCSFSISYLHIWFFFLLIGGIYPFKISPYWLQTISSYYQNHFEF